MSQPLLPVLIVGGGFSGAMLAVRLAEKGRSSLIIEQSDRAGLGVAYGTKDDNHRLNVRAANMGALADDPAHFLKWLDEHYPDLADGDAFISRRLYGQYLEQRLLAARTAYPDHIRTLKGRALEIDGLGIVLDDGRRIDGSDIVIATGNPSPRSHLTGKHIIADPWASGALDDIGPKDNLFILGTSLTMADVVLGLLKRGWTGQATALSRRGLMPRAHIRGHPPAPQMPVEALSGPLSRRLRAARKLALSEQWQSVMDGYRPITGRLWQEATTTVRARFLRHLRPMWDVHRHRIAPDVHDTLKALICDGRLNIQAGRLGPVDVTPNGLRVSWTPSPRRAKGMATPHTVEVDRFINCTGPAHDVLATPLTASLVDAGRARLDALGQGLDLDGQAHLLDANGQPQPHLFALGPPTRAAYWESTAVPDIRRAIEALSDTLSHQG